MKTSAFSHYGTEWFSGVANLRRDVLAGMVGTFALIPEVIAFAFVAGIDPEVGLFASFTISIVIAFAGGRPAMISGAAGSVAFVAASLVASHGLQYLLAATVLAGVMQVVFGLLRLDVLMRFVSRSVRTGFVNALAILIFSAQVPHMLGVTWHTYALIAAGLAIIYLLPRVITAIPSPLDLHRCPDRRDDGCADARGNCCRSWAAAGVAAEVTDSARAVRSARRWSVIAPYALGHRARRIVGIDDDGERGG